MGSPPPSPPPPLRALDPDVAMMGINAGHEPLVSMEVNLGSTNRLALRTRWLRIRLAQAAARGVLGPFVPISAVAPG